MIEKIENYQEYQTKLKNYRKTHRVRYFNHYLMKKDIEFLIREERLFYLDNEDAFTIFEKKDRYYQMYFFTESQLPSVQELDIPIRFDYLSRKKTDVQFLEVIEDKGFDLLSENLEMKRDSTPFSKDRFSMYQFDMLQAKDADFLHRIWIETLESEVNPIPSIESMRTRLENIFVLKKGKEILGGVYVQDLGRSFLIEHFAIDRNQQNIGLGQIMLEKLLMRFPEKKWTLWVQKKNERALRFYDKNQFRFSGRKSYQFKKDV